MHLVQQVNTQLGQLLLLLQSVFHVKKGIMLLLLAVLCVLCVHTLNTACNRQEPQSVPIACSVMQVITSTDVGLQAPAHALSALHAVLARIIPRALERPAGPAPTVAHVLQVIIG